MVVHRVGRRPGRKRFVLMVGRAAKTAAHPVLGERVGLGGQRDMGARNVSFSGFGW